MATPERVAEHAGKVGAQDLTPYSRGISAGSTQGCSTGKLASNLSATLRNRVIKCGNP